MSVNRILSHLTAFRLFTAAAVTFVGDTNGTGVDISTLEGNVAAILESAAGAGTTPTLDIRMQHSDDDGSSDAYTDITGAAFAQVDDTAGGSTQKIVFHASEAKKWVRAVATIAGSAGQSFTFAVALAGVPKYV